MGSVTTSSGSPSWSLAARRGAGGAGGGSWLGAGGEVVEERLVIGVGRVVLDDRDDCSGADETGEVVDVAVGVVADDAAAEPEDVADAEVIGEDALEGLPVESRVPGLDRAEEAF